MGTFIKKKNNDLNHEKYNQIVWMQLIRQNHNEK